MLKLPFYTFFETHNVSQTIMFQDKVLQPRVGANKAGSGSNDKAKCLLVTIEMVVLAFSSGSPEPEQGPHLAECID